MQTIGQLIRDTRRLKNRTVDDLSRETRIKGEFIRAVEAGAWDKLPEYTVVVGFVKNLASALGMEQEKAVALFRRDYPPKGIPPAPKPDIKEKKSLGPKAVFAAGVTLVVLSISSYLWIQYRAFVSPPELEVSSPPEGALIVAKEIKVSGKTDSGSTIRVNNQPAVVDDQGNFEATIELVPGENEIVIRAISRSNKETVSTRKVVVE